MSGNRDAIVMQMTRQMEQTQKMLESAKEPWYRRLRMKKSSG